MPNPNLPINFRKNTYIGARYVPKFSDTPGSEWDNSIQYEPLTIVLYQGNSYTSKTFVPIGVDINNTTYWAPTGNYNAQVEQYRQEVLQYLGNRPFRGCKDFGMGDGKDDTTKFQSAIEQCATNKWILWVEEYMTLNISDTLNLPANSFIRIDGKIMCSSPNKLFNNLDGNPHPGYTGKSNIVIYGNGQINETGQSASTIQTLISFAHANGIMINGITFNVEYTTHIFEIISCKNVYIYDVQVYGQGITNDYHNSAIQIEAAVSPSGQGGAIPYDGTPCTHLNISRCYFEGIDTGISSESQGETIYEHSNIIIDNCCFVNILNSGVTPFGFKDSVIQNCYFNGGGKGLINANYHGQGTHSSNLSILNNVILNAGTGYTGAGTYQSLCPIYVGFDKNTIVKGNIIKGSNGVGIFANTSSNLYIENNDFSDLCKYNVDNKSATTPMLSFPNSVNVFVRNNAIKTVHGDVYTNTVFGGHNPECVQSNLINIPVKTGVSNTYNTTTITSGDKSVGDVIACSKSPFNFEKLVILYQIHGGTQVSAILENTGYTGHSVGYATDNQGYMAYCHFTLANDSITWDTGRVVNLTTGAIDNSIIIKTIRGVSNGNIIM